MTFLEDILQFMHTGVLTKKANIPRAAESHQGPLEGDSPGPHLIPPRPNPNLIRKQISWLAIIMCMLIIAIFVCTTIHFSIPPHYKGCRIYIYTSMASNLGTLEWCLLSPSVAKSIMMPGRQRARPGLKKWAEPHATKEGKKIGISTDWLMNYSSLWILTGSRFTKRF